MFVNHTHVPQALDADAYTSQGQHDREVERLFLPGWHCVALTSDLPRDGDYVTTELFGRPLIVWRVDGRPHTFLNVCAHRFSTLSDKPCGHSGQTLRCQYHGWEYGADGATRKIPDAKMFRPMTQGMVGLTKFRTETRGRTVFMTFDPDAPPLDEWLGPVGELSDRWLSPDHVPLLTDDRIHEANWKVVVENFLEAYHLECVHPKTFKTYPDESRCTHEFHDGWDWYRDDYSKEGNALERLISLGAGVEPGYTWHHVLRYPNTIYLVMALFSMVQSVVPVAPNRCRVVTRIIVNPGRRGTVRARIMAPLLKAWGGRFWRQVLAEDAGAFPSVQRGLESAEQSRGGLISVREERVAVFQKYVLENTSGESAPAGRPPAPAKPLRRQPSNPSFEPAACDGTSSCAAAPDLAISQPRVPR
jgi:phenylpropionate dioxygenase-like ring-hydroxylating dioxygenase large terminal subunit